MADREIDNARQTAEREKAAARQTAERDRKMAERETAAARREVVNTRWIVATITVGVIVIIAAVNLLLIFSPLAGG